MNSTDYRLFFFWFLALQIVLVEADPRILSDENVFLKGFVNHELLAIIGFFTTLTLAIGFQVHFLLNKAAKEAGEISGFPKTRKSLRRSINTSIFVFIISFQVVFFKEYFVSSVSSIIVCNSLAVTTIFLSICVLYDLANTVLRLKHVAL